MDFLTAFRHQTAQLYSKVFPQPCFLCGAQSTHLPLCEGCISDLPLLGNACKRCAIPISSGDICGSCLKKPPLQNASFSLYRYEDGVRSCITAFKFDQQLSLSRLFSEMIYRQLKHSENLPACLIPIPLHPKRIRTRGFNQSALITQQLAKRLNISYLNNCLIRIKNTTPQTTLTLQARKRNLKQAFAWQGHHIPRHVALVDDVMTSGATGQAAAQVLKSVGVETIELWTIARAISHY